MQSGIMATKKRERITGVDGEVILGDDEIHGGILIWVRCINLGKSWEGGGEGVGGGVKGLVRTE